MKKYKVYKKRFKVTEEIKKFAEEETNSEEVIKDLVNTNWGTDNESQMKASELIKGLSLSNEPIANAFMKKIDDFTSNINIDELK